MNIDATAYPVVRMDSDPALSVPVEEVLATISKLLARGQPFVFVGKGELGGDDGNVADRRKVALWMKANKVETRRLVRGHVQIVPDAAKRTAAETFSIVFSKFWGYPMFVVAKVEQARAKAEALLAS